MMHSSFQRNDCFGEQQRQQQEEQQTEQLVTTGESNSTGTSLDQATSVLAEVTDDGALSASPSLDDNACFEEQQQQREQLVTNESNNSSIDQEQRVSPEVTDDGALSASHSLDDNVCFEEQQQKTEQLVTNESNSSSIDQEKKILPEMTDDGASKARHSIHDGFCFSEQQQQQQTELLLTVNESNSSNSMSQETSAVQKVTDDGAPSARSKRRRESPKNLQPPSWPFAASEGATAAKDTEQQQPDAGFATGRKKAKKETAAKKQTKQEHGKRTTLTLHQRRRERKKNERMAKRQQEKVKGGRVVDKDGDELYWEMDKVIGRRVRNGRVEYLIRWKGCDESENTWEPTTNLCDSAMADAIRFSKEETEREKKRQQDERSLGLVGRLSVDDDMFGSTEPCRSIRFGPLDAKRSSYAGVLQESVPSSSEVDTDPQFGAREMDVDEELPWQWNDEEQVTFRDIVRIDVNEESAAERVTEARLNGTPVVLVGHVGWANFANRWMSKDETMEGKENDDEDSSLLDLSQPLKLDVCRMIEDIGDDEVPVVRQDYNEENPIDGNIKIKRFLRTCWNDSTPEADVTVPRLYLHQWQFPLSEMTGGKLCHQNSPLPNDILGEDLLKYWLDLPQCKEDSVLQYLFMGVQGTMSKLHRDNGGLAISIAPIVGEKECVCVHRSDGASCLYHLDAKLDDIDLQSFPLLAQARIWKTVVRPGEILLMPHGTYHQCRNLTPCLSYSRFHLDTVNIFAFLQSMIDGDAKEIAHEEIIWNATTELIKKVDAYVDKVQCLVKRLKPLDDAPLTTEMVRIVKTLRCLRNICREIGRRRSVQIAVKRKDISAGMLQQEIAMANGLSHEVPSKSTEEWDIITDDIDLCLHDFRHRKMTNVPTFRPRRLKSTEVAMGLKSHEVNGHGLALENAFRRLPDVPGEELGSSLPRGVEISEGESVTVHLMGKSIKGLVLQVAPEMMAALLSYEEFPPVYDEYQPYERLRVPMPGEMGTELKHKHAKPGSIVTNRQGSFGEDYRAVIVSTLFGTFYKVQLEVGSVKVDRWLTRDSLVKVHRILTCDTKAGFLEWGED